MDRYLKLTEKYWENKHKVCKFNKKRAINVINK